MAGHMPCVGALDRVKTARGCDTAVTAGLLSSQDATRVVAREGIGVVLWMQKGL